MYETVQLFPGKGSLQWRKQTFLCNISKDSYMYNRGNDRTAFYFSVYFCIIIDRAQYWGENIHKTASRQFKNGSGPKLIL